MSGSPSPGLPVSASHDDRLLNLLGQIAMSLSEIARYLTPDAPNYRRALGEFSTFDWSSIGARVVKTDDFGPSQVEWGDNVFTRRSPENKFDTAIWFSRPTGKDPDGNNKFERLISFRKLTDAEPISRKAEQELRAATPAPVVGAGLAPAHIAPPASSPASESTTDNDPVTNATRAWDNLPSRSAATNGAQPASTTAPAPVDACPHCGKSIQHDNRDCFDHRVPTIGSNGAKAKPKRQATLPAGRAGADFRIWAKQFAGNHAEYQQNKGGDVDMYHILMTVASLGYPDITADNIAQIQELLSRHAEAQP